MAEGVYLIVLAFVRDFSFGMDIEFECCILTSGDPAFDLYKILLDFTTLSSCSIISVN